MDLREWTIIYVKHRDLMTKKLQGYEEKNGKLVFTFKDHHMHAYAVEKLSVPTIEGKTLLVTLQTKENVEFLLKHWSEYNKHADLTMVFVHPEKNEKWAVIPHTHAQVSDPNFEQGIRSMADSVSYVN